MSYIEKIGELSGDNAALRYYAGELLGMLKAVRDGDTAMLDCWVGYAKRTAKELGVTCVEVRR